MKPNSMARRVAFVMAVAWICALATAAQGRRASITVRVESSDKVPIVGAKVVVTNEKTKQSSTLTTDVSGSSFLDPIAPGRYVVELSAKGFVPDSRAVRVKPGKKVKVHARLKSTTPKKKSRWLQ
ncbi:MAG TPA: carboxypeptidase-like regulatory domain-containing protein [Candidatus Acidoferrales bacterium]|nr:carboxypeptidase-like regulatory domain-containing protein [Candidatus Acidoferrales bacterium]